MPASCFRAGAWSSSLSKAGETDQMVATLNVRDLLLLARSAELHAGLIVLRVPNLSLDDQWRNLEPAIDLVLAKVAAGRSLVNRLIEIVGPEMSSSALDML